MASTATTSVSGLTDRVTNDEESDTKSGSPNVGDFGLSVLVFLAILERQKAKRLNKNKKGSRPRRRRSSSSYYPHDTRQAANASGEVSCATALSEHVLPRVTSRSTLSRERYTNITVHQADDDPYPRQTSSREHRKRARLLRRQDRRQASHANGLPVYRSSSCDEGLPEYKNNVPYKYIETHDEMGNTAYESEMLRRRAKGSGRRSHIQYEQLDGSVQSEANQAFETYDLEQCGHTSGYVHPFSVHDMGEYVLFQAEVDQPEATQSGTTQIGASQTGATRHEDSDKEVDLEGQTHATLGFKVDDETVGNGETEAKNEAQGRNPTMKRAIRTQQRGHSSRSQVQEQDTNSFEIFHYRSTPPSFSGTCSIANIENVRELIGPAVSIPPDGRVSLPFTQFELENLDIKSAQTIVQQISESNHRLRQVDSFGVMDFECLPPDLDMLSPMVRGRTRNRRRRSSNSKKKETKSALYVINDPLATEPTPVAWECFGSPSMSSDWYRGQGMFSKLALDFITASWNRIM